MDVPHRYPYNPPLRFYLLSFGTGFLWISVEWHPNWLGGHIPTGFSLWSSFIGLIPIALAFVVGVRRVWVEHYLLLDHDSIVVPIGLFQMRTAKIEYTSVKRIWRHYPSNYDYTFLLRVATEDETFKIVPGFLPDKESYRALEEFLNRKALENRARKSPQDASCR